jgi:hypothetical protein
MITDQEAEQGFIYTHKKGNGENGAGKGESPVQKVRENKAFRGVTQVPEQSLQMQ